MTPYRYFKDKEEILAAVRARAFDKFSATLEAAYDAQPKATDGASAIAAASAVADAYIRFALDDPDSYRLMFDTKHGDASLYPELARAGDRARATLTRHVGPLIETGMTDGNPVLIGHVYWSFIHGAVMLTLSGSTDYDLDGTVTRGSGHWGLGLDSEPAYCGPKAQGTAGLATAGPHVYRKAANIGSAKRTDTRAPHAAGRLAGIDHRQA